MCCRCQKSTDKNVNESDCMAAKFAYKRNPVLDKAKPPKRPIRNCEEQVWDIARTAESGLTIKGIRNKVVGEITYNRVKAWLEKWQSAGYVARTVNTNTYPPTYLYEVIHDCGQQPPQVDGKGVPKKPSGNEIVWRTARILKNFNARQIIASANDGDTALNERAVRLYLLHLYEAGYITWLNTEDTQSLAQYMLTVNTGPKAPEIQRGKKVYDGNLNLIVYDPETPLPPSHQSDKNNSKQAKKGAGHV